MRLVAADEVTNKLNGKWCRRWISTESELVTCPLDEGFDVFPRPRSDTDLSLGHCEVGVRLEVLVEFFEADI